MVNRTRFEIMTDILTFCRQPRGKTRVMYHTNLSWKRNQMYLNKLESKGLLQIHHSPILYVTTQKGRAFIEKMAQLNQLL